MSLLGQVRRHSKVPPIIYSSLRQSNAALSSLLQMRDNSPSVSPGVLASSIRFCARYSVGSNGSGLQGSQGSSDRIVACCERVPDPLNTAVFHSSRSLRSSITPGSCTLSLQSGLVAEASLIFLTPVPCRWMPLLRPYAFQCLGLCY
jgi:hypothetical protein